MSEVEREYFYLDDIATKSMIDLVKVAKNTVKIIDLFEELGANVDDLRKRFNTIFDINVNILLEYGDRETLVLYTEEESETKPETPNNWGYENYG